MKIKCFRDLEIWKLGKEIVKDIYRLSESMPVSQRYGISSQMQRAAISIPSNIAEGFNRFQNKEYRRFLYIALGSCAELETQVEICSDLQYLSGEQKNSILDKINHESKMLANLIKCLQ